MPTPPPTDPTRYDRYLCRPGGQPLPGGPGAVFTLAEARAAVGRAVRYYELLARAVRNSQSNL